MARRGAVAGRAEIGFAIRAGATRLTHLFQHDPLRVLFPTPLPGELPSGVLVTTSGGLVGGDEVAVAVRLDEAAAAHVTASAAEKVYRSIGPPAIVEQHLVIAAGGWLEFLPPETILFEGARLRRQTLVSLGTGAGFLGGDILVFGRRARGERLTTGLVHEEWRVERDGVLVWGDALHLDGDIGGTIDDPACFAGAEACATLILAVGRADHRALLDLARSIQARHAADRLRGGASMIAGLLVARWLAWDAARLRAAYADLACQLRAAAMGLPPRLPRLWHV